MSTVEIPRRILRRVEKPARYTGGEWNAVHKDVNGPPRTRFAFCFPDVYDIGMSNLALHILYDRINRRDDAWCERVFAPWPDMEQAMRAAGLPLFSLESKTPLAAFDVVGFTLQYELSFSNVLNMLDLAGIPLLTSERTEADPLVCCGGPAVFNLEPVAGFFDFALIGEGEELLDAVLDEATAYRTASNPDRAAFLRKLARIPGVYVPSLYEPEYNEDGTLKVLRPLFADVPETVTKRFVRDLDTLPILERPVVPHTEIVHDRVFLELFRGCTRGCRFCQAGFIYRPVREKGVDLLVRQEQQAEQATGYDEVGMLSLSTSDYSQLGELTNRLLNGLDERHTSLSLPSLRVDSFSLDLMQKAARTRRSGLTFAPEAGSQRMRDVINKNVTKEDLLRSAELAFSGGWSSIKLYFMIGLPGETMEDVEAIAELARELERMYYALPREQRRRRLELTVSTSVFIPKPFTPFQWEPQDGRATVVEKQQRLKELLKSRSIRYQWHDPDVSHVEAVLARGDRRLQDAVLAAWKAGCRFDAWDEYFLYDTWIEAIRGCGLDPDFYACREREQDEVFPWEVLDCGVRRSYLARERDRSKTGQTTPSCTVSCNVCGMESEAAGICSGIQAVPAEKPEQAHAAETETPPETHVLRVSFARSGTAAFLGHLDMMRLFERALRRAGVPLAYSHGFNPRPHLVFAFPLGVGLLAEQEWLDIETMDGYTPEQLQRDLPACLPEGVALQTAQLAPDKSKSLMALVQEAVYRIEAPGIATAALKLEALHELPVKRTRKGKTTTTDIRPLILSVQTGDSPDRVRFHVRAGSAQNLRPDILLEAAVAYADLDRTDADDAVICREQVILSGD